VIEPSEATAPLQVHITYAVVFDNEEDFDECINDENLDVDENCILALKNCDPKGYPGMAEVGKNATTTEIMIKFIAP
jgi:dihydroxy-acid dehydratase